MNRLFLLLAVCFSFLVIGSLGRAQDGKLLKRLDQLAELWIDEGRYLSIRKDVEDLRKNADSDPELARELLLAATILSKDGSRAKIGAVWEIAGDDSKAYASYRYVQNLAAVELHRIGILRRLHPEWEKAHLGDAVDQKYYGTRSYGVARLQSLAIWLDRQHEKGVKQLDGKYEHSESLIMGRYGPPLWSPDSLPERDSLRSSQMRKLQEDAFAQFCRSSLQFENSASWAFSRLGALADLEGEFSGNETLLDAARTAMDVMGKPTPWKSIPGPQMGTTMFSKNVPVRFFSPELYLAYREWKRNPAREPTNQGVRERWNLLSCDRSDFSKLADQYLGKDPSSGLPEVVQIWKLRGADLRLLNYLLDIESRTERANFQNEANLRRAWCEYLDEVATAKHPALARQAIGQLIYANLGPDDDRKAMPKDDPKKKRLARLLKDLADYDSLVFPAYIAAEKAGLPLLVQYWVREKQFAATPEVALSKINRSPLVGSIEEFRLLESKSLQFVDGRWHSRKTLFEKVAVLIAELPETQQVPYLESLRAKDSFGANFLLAEIASFSRSRRIAPSPEPIESFLHDSLAAIRDAPLPLRQELSGYVYRRLAEESPENIAIRSAFSNELNQRLAELKKRVVESVSSGRSYGDPGSLAILIGLSPSVAVEALREAHQRAPRLIGVDPGQDETKKIAVIRGMIGQAKFQVTRERFTNFYVAALSDPELSKVFIPLRAEWLAPRFNRTSKDNIKQFQDRCEWIKGHWPTNYRPELIALVTGPEYSSAFWEEMKKSGKEVTEIGEVFSDEDRRKWAEARLRCDQAFHEGVWPPREVWIQFLDALRDPDLAPSIRVGLLRTFAYRNQNLPKDKGGSLELADATAGLWKSDVRDRETSELILQSFLKQVRSDKWRNTARNLLASTEHFENRKFVARGASRSPYSPIPGLLVHIALELDDRDFLRLIEENYGNERLFTRSPVEHLAHFIRNDQSQWAHRVIEENSERLRGGFAYGSLIETDGGGYAHLPIEPDAVYDRALHEKLPLFLDSVSSPVQRIAVGIYINAAVPDESDKSLPSYIERMTTLAEEFLKLETNDIPPETLTGIAPVLRGLVVLPTVGERLAPLLLQKVPFDHLDEIIQRNPKDPLIDTYFDAVFASLITNLNWASIHTSLGKITKQQKSGSEDYSFAWSCVLKGLERGSSARYRTESAKTGAAIREVFRVICEASPGSGAEHRFVIWSFHTGSPEIWKEWRNGLSEAERDRYDLIWRNADASQLYRLAYSAISHQNMTARWHFVKAILNEPILLDRFEEKDRTRFVDSMERLLDAETKARHREELDQLRKVF